MGHQPSPEYLEKEVRVALGGLSLVRAGATDSARTQVLTRPGLGPLQSEAAPEFWKGGSNQHGASTVPRISRERWEGSAGRSVVGACWCHGLGTHKIGRASSRERTAKRGCSGVLEGWQQPAWGINRPQNI